MKKILALTALLVVAPSTSFTVGVNQKKFVFRSTALKDGIGSYDEELERTAGGASFAAEVPLPSEEEQSLLRTAEVRTLFFNWMNDYEKILEDEDIPGKKRLWNDVFKPALDEEEAARKTVAVLQQQELKAGKLTFELLQVFRSLKMECDYADSENLSDLRADCSILLAKYAIANRSAPTEPSDRGAFITDGLNRELAHGFDLTAFGSRIDELFEWHVDNSKAQNDYNSPYFAVVQSSGMGKTKLFTEYRKLCQSSQILCKTILCIKAAGLEQYKREAYYNHTLIVNPRQSEQDIRVMIRRRLEEFLPKGDGEKVVFLFDEAQGLMDRNIHSIAFRAIRWWLREKRRQQVVAVFAGTTTKLSIFFGADPPAIGTSRDPTITYQNYEKGQNDNKSLYPPFYKLHTISCLRAAAGEKAEHGEAKEFEEASIYGRPLFAHYYLDGSLNEAKMHSFVKRLVLSENEYENHLTSCYSVLGTRVQMGTLNSFEASSQVVSTGYACLVDFELQPRGSSPPVAAVAFMPDPVCATIAMRFMDEEWADGKLKGRSKCFWVTQAEKAFSTKLCRPDKGDVGEVFAALYMLFCADVLRKRQDASLSQFTVSLDDWFRLLKRGGSSKEEKTDSSTTTLLSKRGGSTSIRFVQFCRNDLRSNFVCDSSVLKYMYQSGVGFYAYPDCRAFDLVSSIHVESTGTYHPLLVSVKNWKQVAPGDVARWENATKSFLENFRANEEDPKAVCLVILLGCQTISERTCQDYILPNLKDFPEQDVFSLVRVQDDSFGIDDAIGRLGSVSESEEIYSSHAILTCESSWSENLLRKSSEKTDELKSLFQALRDV